jgi:NADP-dependent aldehyde dehydrogenase
MMTAELHGKSLLAGKPLETAGRPFNAVSPLDGQPLEPAFHECTLVEVDDALQAAEAAFVIYRRTSPEERAAFLERIADEIGEIGDALLDRAHRETGLPLDRLTGERARTMGQLRLFAEVIREGSWVDARIDRPLPERKPMPRPDLRRVMLPLGPIIVFGSSNFPFAFSVAGGDTASALAAGNPVIVKAHRAHPGTSELVAEAVTRAAASSGLPAGVFSMLHGSGQEIGTALVRHPLTRGAGFTGSRTAGRSLFDAANARPDPIPVFAEMSSLNPVFILPGALRERGTQIADGLKASVTMGVGQFCTKPGLVFGLGGPDLQAFAAAFAERIRAAAPGTMLHPGIHRAFRDGIETMERCRASSQSRTRTSSRISSARKASRSSLPPTPRTSASSSSCTKRSSGPYTLLVDAPEMADLIAIAQQLEGQLTARSTARRRSGASLGADRGARAQSWRLLFNGFPTGVEVCAAMQHGGPYPATTDARFTSVGTAAIQRWVRPVCYQKFPAAALPPALQDANPLRIMRLVDNELTREPLRPSSTRIFATSANKNIPSLSKTSPRPRLPPEPMPSLPLNRRRFLTLSATLSAGIFAAPAILRSQAPNSKLNIAVIGCGGKGGDNLGHYLSETSSRSATSTRSTSIKAAPEWRRRPERIHGQGVSRLPAALRRSVRLRCGDRLHAGPSPLSLRRSARCS